MDEITVETHLLNSFHKLEKRVLAKEGVTKLVYDFFMSTISSLCQRKDFL